MDNLLNNLFDNLLTINYTQYITNNGYTKKQMFTTKQVIYIIIATALAITLFDLLTALIINTIN